MWSPAAPSPPWSWAGPAPAGPQRRSTTGSPGSSTPSSCCSLVVHRGRRRPAAQARLAALRRRSTRRRGHRPDRQPLRRRRGRQRGLKDGPLHEALALQALFAAAPRSWSTRACRRRRKQRNRSHRNTDQAESTPGTHRAPTWTPGGSPAALLPPWCGTAVRPRGLEDAPLREAPISSPRFGPRRCAVTGSSDSTRPSSSLPPTPVSADRAGSAPVTQHTPTRSTGRHRQADQAVSPPGKRRPPTKAPRSSSAVPSSPWG